MFATAIENMTVCQIKEELRTLYGETDFSSCIELTDLRQKLAATRETKLISYGLKYGPLLEIGNKQGPSGIVTLTHGLGDSAKGWEDVALDLSRRLPHLLFLLPTASMQPVGINGGAVMNSWYDIRNASSGNSMTEDTDAIMKSADYLKSLAYTATRRYQVPPNRVVYAGFSQGAVISIAAGLTARLAPAGVAALSGYFAAVDKVLPQLCNKSLPVLLCHGTHDNIIPFSAAQKTKETLESLGVGPVTLCSYPMEHSSHPKEIVDVEKFLQQALPKPSANS